MAPPTIWPSVVVSAALVLAARRLTVLAEAPWLTLVFYTMLPTLASIACVQEGKLLGVFQKLTRWAWGPDDPVDSTRDGKLPEALAAARSELHRALTDRWPTAHPGGGGSFAFSRAAAALARHPTQVGSELLRQPGTAISSGNGNGGKSLYDQVKDHLSDHVFVNHQDAPIYFMDPANGSFLRVNEQHKLVFTTSPDASCLFHVVKGKTHHWGFHSTVHQRYLGQNFMGKVVVSSRKLSSWESFRVLEQPDSDLHGPARKIYLVLCSARFGKGMWLAKNQRRSSDTYLSKTFANALALVYASDLSAFEYLSRHVTRRVLVSPASAPTGDVGSSSIDVSGLLAPAENLGAAFQAPVLMNAERSRISLPWIEDAQSKRFFELSEKEMTEVISTTISRVSIREILEFFINQDARRECHEKTSQAPPRPAAATAPPTASSTVPPTGGDTKLCEWHLHPNFGFVRKLSYRPPAPGSAPSGSDQQHGQESSPSSRSTLATIAIDQYHSCIVNETTMQKASFRTKMYTLSIPHSNCFSVETIFEFQELADRDIGTFAPTSTFSTLIFKCRAGVHFSRPTSFRAQIEKGALEGVKKTCDRLLQLADQHRLQRQASSVSLKSSNAPDGNVADPPVDATSVSRDAFPPHTLAIEVIKGMIRSIRRSDGGQPSSLVVQMPWMVSSKTGTSPASATSETATTASSPYAIAGFFESPSEAFMLALSEKLDAKINPQLVFETLLSDECSFFHGIHQQSGNMEVDIGAWRSVQLPHGREPIHVRKQVFLMPVSGIPGVDVVRVEDYQCYAMRFPVNTASDSASPSSERLEFGMKTFARDLPDGESFSIEVMVIIDAMATMQVFCSVARSRRNDGSDAPVKMQHGGPTITEAENPRVVNGTARGVKTVWKRVAQILDDACGARLLGRVDPQPHIGDIRDRLRVENKLPSHDELASGIVETIVAAGL